MDKCICYIIEKEIEEKYPDADWNMDEACDEWHKRKKEIPDNNITFESDDDRNYGCTCPACGRRICGWCV